jgi:hypothetical protein
VAGAAGEAGEATAGVFIPIVFNIFVTDADI